MISRPDDIGGSIFGLTDQYRRVTKFGIELNKLTNSKYYRANLYWTENGRVSTVSDNLVVVCDCKS